MRWRGVFNLDVVTKVFLKCATTSEKLLLRQVASLLGAKDENYVVEIRVARWYIFEPKIPIWVNV
jgi:hypothetical protein